MHDDPFEGLIGSRPQGSDYWSERPDPANSEIPFYGSMLEQDMDDLFPHDFNRIERFTAKIDASESAERIILNALPSVYGFADNLEDGLRRLAEECTYVLLRGACYLEVEYFHPSDSAKPTAFMLHVVGADEITRTRGRTIRYVADSQSEHVRRGRHYVELERGSLVEIRLPAPQRKSLDRATRALRRAGRQHGRMYKLVTRDKPVLGFSVTEYQVILDNYVRRSTRALGWDGRQSLTGHNLEPYRVWREISFARYKIVVRDSILAALSHSIRNAGAQIGFEASLVVDGLLDDADLDRATDDLLTGARSLYDISREVQMLPPRPQSTA